MKHTKHKNLVLSIAHHIFLSRDECYALTAGNTINIVSHNIPVWFFSGISSEPATEVFCRYGITNKPGTVGVEFADQGYEINIPQLPENYVSPKQVPNEEWKAMTIEQQTMWYHNHEAPINGENLLDIADGGSEGLQFQIQYKARKESQVIDVLHYVTISRIEKLITSLM